MPEHAASGSGDRREPLSTSPLDFLALDRRQFLRLTAASLSLAGAGACSRAPQQTIVPYVHAPPQLVAGDPLYFATAANLCGAAQGLLVKSNYGRPTKIEGNPSHPGSLGATDIFAQAAVLDLWDPDRAQAVLHRGQASTWDAFVAALSARISRLSVNGRDRTAHPDRERHLADARRSVARAARALPRRTLAPVSADQSRPRLRGQPPRFWRSPRSALSLRPGARGLEPGQRFSGCAPAYATRAILSARAAAAMPSPIRAGSTSSNARRRSPAAFADHRYAARFGQIEAIARALAQAVGLPVAGTLDAAVLPSGALAACARDLKLNAGRALVVVGDAQPPIVHALAHAINEALANVGRTVSYTAPILARAEPQGESLRVADRGHGGRAG